MALRIGTAAVRPLSAALARPALTVFAWGRAPYRMPPHLAQGLPSAQRRFASAGGGTASASHSENPSEGSSTTAQGADDASVRADDYYKRLGISRDASEADIKAAYRRLAMKYHPDAVSGDKAKATEDFQHIKEAYETLSDPRKRRLYNVTGSSTGRIRLNLSMRGIAYVVASVLILIWILRKSKREAEQRFLPLMATYLFMITFFPERVVLFTFCFTFHALERIESFRLRELAAISVQVDRPSSPQSAQGTLRIYHEGDDVARTSTKASPKLTNVSARVVVSERAVAPAAAAADDDDGDDDGDEAEHREIAVVNQPLSESCVLRVPWPKIGQSMRYMVEFSRDGRIIGQRVLHATGSQ